MEWVRAHTVQFPFLPIRWLIRSCQLQSNKFHPLMFDKLEYPAMQEEESDGDG